jgi:hypothetical protein
MPDIHLAISHGFYETVRVGSPTCFRNVSVQCMSTIRTKGVTG